MKRTVRDAKQNLALILKVLCASVVLLASPCPAVAQKKPQTPVTPTTLPKPTPTPASEQAIPLPQIATRANELSILLGEMVDRLAPQATLNSIDLTLRSQENSILAQQREAEDLIASNPTIIELNEQEKDWKAIKDQSDASHKTLKEGAIAVETALSTLGIHQIQWENTRTQIQAGNSIQPVLDRIQNALNEIQATRKEAIKLLTQLVELQNRVSQQDQVVADVLKKLDQAKSKLQRGMFEPNGQPLWKANAPEQSDQAHQDSFQTTIKHNVTRTRDFIVTRRRGLMMILAYYLASLVIFFALRRRILLTVKEQPSLEKSAIFFRRPASLSLLATLIVILPYTANLPILIKTIFTLFFVIPVLRFLPTLIGPLYRPLLYLLVGFGLTEGLREMFGVSPREKRWITVGMCLIIVVVGSWLTRPGRVHKLRLSGQHATLTIFAIRAVLALILASLVANVFGYLTLSRVLMAGAVQGSFFAVALYTAFISTIAFHALFWRSHHVSALSIVRTHQESAAKWGSRLLGLVAFAIWLNATLKLFTIRQWVLSAFTDALTTKIAVGAVSFKLSDVLTFVLILGLGVVFANITRFVLYADVLEPLSLKHGLPYAISTITYYILVLLCFYFALAAAGVELSRFALLTGAIGVGMGFGLRDIINNFVSGLILLFERPIRIGDWLEVGASSGEVERIGTRSTSIRTVQGAEVIVPNSVLISGQVTNWTLNEWRRRSELLVKVPLGTDPEGMIKLLVEAAASHPDVLDDPKPSAIFLGFDDHALGFELSFWVPTPLLHQQVKSDLGVKVAAALRKAEISLA